MENQKEIETTKEQENAQIITKKDILRFILFFVSIICLFSSFLFYGYYDRISSKNYVDDYGTYSDYSGDLKNDVKNLEYQIFDNPEKISDDKGLFYYVIDQYQDKSYTNIPKNNLITTNERFDIYKYYENMENDSHKEKIGQTAMLAPSNYLMKQFINSNNYDDKEICGYIYIPNPEDTKNLHVLDYVTYIKQKQASALNMCKNVGIGLFLVGVVLFLISVGVLRKSKLLINNSAKKVSRFSLPVQAFILFVSALALTNIHINIYTPPNNSVFYATSLIKSLGILLIASLFIISSIVNIISILNSDKYSKKVLAEKNLIKLMYTSKGFVIKMTYTIMIITYLMTSSMLFVDAVFDLRVNSIGLLIFNTFFLVFCHVVLTRWFLSRYVKKSMISGQIPDFNSQDLFFSFASKDTTEIQNQYKGLKKETEASVNMKNELIANVSHDLKTPLTSIINYIELIKASENCTGDIKEYADILTIKADKLKDLVDDLFEISKLNSGTITIKKQKIDFKQLVEQVLGELDYEINSASLIFELNYDENLRDISADSQLLYRAINNVIVNITKYSKPNTKAYIDVTQNSNTISVCMLNTSLEPLDTETNNLFERFTRSDSSRNTEGHGLGLAIFYEVIQLHDGTAYIDADENLFKLNFTLKN